MYYTSMYPKQNLYVFGVILMLLDCDVSWSENPIDFDSREGKTVGDLFLPHRAILPFLSLWCE